MPDELELLGLSVNESKVYRALVKLGSASVSEVAAKTKVHRVNVYDALRRLEEKGLVSSVIKAEKNYFEAASPEQLKLILKNKEEELDQVKKEIPFLLEEYKLKKVKQEVHHYKGKRGLITIYENMFRTLKPGGTIYSIGTTGVMRDILKFYIADFNRKRVKNKIHLKSLYYQRAKGKTVFPKQERKFIPAGFGFLPVTTYIYGDRVAILSFDELLGIEIISKGISKSYMQYFNWLWNESES
ncbi:hypothetical protein KY306_00845 [Candidatus Woesearchaeota archaeon]|nr:hypothetical protein [Candidatus Woesearchaeota archaeon]